MPSFASRPIWNRLQCAAPNPQALLPLFLPVLLMRHCNLNVPWQGSRASSQSIERQGWIAAEPKPFGGRHAAPRCQPAPLYKCTTTPRMLVDPPLITHTWLPAPEPRAGSPPPSRSARWATTCWPNACPRLGRRTCESRRTARAWLQLPLQSPTVWPAPAAANAAAYSSQPCDHACRLSRAAIVCRRWRSVSTRPELLREVVFDVAEGATLPAAQSLLRWLQRHGQAVRSLVLDLGIRGRLSAVEEMEFVCLLDGCVNVCASSLERLTLNLYTDSYTIGAWVATAHRLKELNLDTQGMTAWVTLAGLISMRRLHLDALRWQLGTAVALPPSLTCLMISNHKADEMPTQVRAAEAHLQCLQHGRFMLHHLCFMLVSVHNKCSWAAVGSRPKCCRLLAASPPPPPPCLSCRWLPSATCTALGYLVVITVQPAWPA